jgi:hypothetical protein
MKKILLLLLGTGILMGLASCALISPPATATPPPRQITNTPPSFPTPTTTLNYTQCYWNWARRPLPELSADLQSTLEAALDLPLTAYAEAYGEDCIDSRTNNVAFFATRQTDFYITLEVDRLTDREALGQAIEQILTILLQRYPVGSTSGPQPGYIGITFAAGTEELRFWLTWEDAESALALGIHGESLLSELERR